MPPVVMPDDPDTDTGGGSSSTPGRIITVNIRIAAIDEPKLALADAILTLNGTIPAADLGLDPASGPYKATLSLVAPVAV